MGLINRFNAVSARLARTKHRAAVGRGPLLSVTFDDFPRSAWTVGGAILQARAVRGTYYAAGRFCGKTVDGVEHFARADLTEIAAAGHEIGCHTWSHKYATRISTAEFGDDCARNVEFLGDALPGVAIESFAYPFGDVSVRVKAAAAERYATARGIRPNVNGNPLDLALLRAMPLERRSWRAEAMQKLAAETARVGGWLILFTHDVADEPTRYGCTPEMLGHALEIAASHGLETLTVREAANRLLQPAEHARASLERAA